jgi:anthranilate synthase component 2
MKTKKVLVIDNYDSFVYNLVHYLEDLECEVTVYRNDEFNIDEIAEFDKILLSPGPGVPEEAGLLKDIIRKYGATKAYLAFALDSKQLAKSMEEHYLILKSIPRYCYNGQNGS